MDAMQILFNGICGIAGFLVIYVLKSITNDIKALHKSSEAHQEKIKNLEQLAEVHDVRRVYMQQALDSIFTLLREIDRKLDGKVDR